VPGKADLVLAALLSDARALLRLRRLLGQLTLRELKARFAGSAGGLLWAWAQPALGIAAYYLVFDVVFALRAGQAEGGAAAPRLGSFLIVGMLAWMAFSDATQRAMNSLVEAGGLLQKNPLPPALFPARAVLASALVFAPLQLALALAYWPMHHGAWAVAALLPLGLALVSTIVRRHGGSVRMASREGVGTRVWLSLPVAGPADTP